MTRPSTSFNSIPFPMSFHAESVNSNKFQNTSEMVWNTEAAVQVSTSLECQELEKRRQSLNRSDNLWWTKRTRANKSTRVKTNLKASTLSTSTQCRSQTPTSCTPFFARRSWTEDWIHKTQPSFSINFSRKTIRNRSCRSTTLKATRQEGRSCKMRSLKFPTRSESC